MWVLFDPSRGPREFHVLSNCVKQWDNTGTPFSPESACPCVTVPLITLRTKWEITSEPQKALQCPLSSPLSPTVLLKICPEVLYPEIPGVMTAVHIAYHV